VSFWKKRAGTTNIPWHDGAAARSTQEAQANAGEYQLLYKYLRDRYANRVVLTFGEIEDLLGFALPDPARLQREWWAGADSTAPRSAQSDSWTLASRTATVNLVAQNVVFDREEAALH
jgi:pullulanase/glycogen debranching enzyme